MGRSEARISPTRPDFLAVSHLRIPDLKDQKDPKRSGRFLRETFEAVREDEKGRRPQSDKDAKSFTVRLRFGRLTPCELPDGDGADNGGKAEDEAEFAEKFQLSGFHIDELNRPKRDKVLQCIFSELAKSLS